METSSASTRTRLLEAALFLFWQNGYAATGMAEILARADVWAGSFYYFFKTKEALLLAVLEYYIQTLDLYVMGPVFSAVTDPIERVFGVLGFYRQNLIKTGCTYGCPIGRLALEIPEEQTQVHRLLADNFDGWTAAIEGCLREVRASLPPDLDLKTLSQFVLTVMEGGVMQARSHRSLAPFDASVEHLHKYFDLLVAQQGQAAARESTTEAERTTE
jgi:TetR/AcrR family transcriptional repressor of nem operon